MGWFDWLKKIFNPSLTAGSEFRTHHGKTYFRIKKSQMPNWVMRRWDKIKAKEESDLEGREFYFKGKKFRYLIRTGIQGQKNGFRIAYYKRQRKKKKKRRYYIPGAGRVSRSQYLSYCYKCKYGG
jgi:hypothetical protein